MLAFVTAPRRGEGDRLLSDLATQLARNGFRLGGVVQVNTELSADRPCLMELRDLTEGHLIRISQNLGAHASGCRLDASGLEDAVGRVEAAMQRRRPDILILNKFGKLEAEGRGFRPLIAQALASGIPVLTSISEKNRPAFERFAEGTATHLSADLAAVMDWCLRQAEGIRG